VFNQLNTALILLIECQNFLQYCCQRLNILHNYFDGSSKLFLDYLVKFLDTLAKLFFPCTTIYDLQ